MSKWRVPTIEELTSLIDYSRHDPALPEGCPINLNPTYYWSSTPAVNYTNSAWRMDFYDGYVVVDGKSSSYCVRCVRQGSLHEVIRPVDYTDSHRFKDMGDGFLDRKTGLVWQRNEDAPKETMTWDEAMKYAEGLL